MRGSQLLRLLIIRSSAVVIVTGYSVSDTVLLPSTYDDPQDLIIGHLIPCTPDSGVFADSANCDGDSQRVQRVWTTRFGPNICENTRSHNIAFDDESYHSSFS